MRYVWAVLFLIACVLVTEGHAATYTVSPGGLAGGLAQLSAGDTLYLRGGTYNESINANNQTIPTGTSWSNPVTIASYPGETAILAPHNAGAVIDFNAYNTSYDIQYIIFDRLIFDADNNTIGVISLLGNPNGRATHHLRFQNSVIKNSSGCGGGYHIVGPVGEPGPTGQGNGLNVAMFDNVHHVEFLRSKIHQSWCGYGFYVSGHDNLWDGNDIYDNSGYGIQIYPSGSNNIIRNNRFYGNGFVRDYGTITVNNASNTQIHNNLIYNNNGGIDSGTNNTVSNTTIYNNTIYGNSNAGIQLGGGSQSAIVRNNIIYQNNADFIDNGSGTTSLNNSTGDPGFVLAGTDFHIALAGSPAVNCCPRLAEVTTDLEGANRSNPTTAGAYEFTGSLPPPDPDPDQMLGRLKFDEGAGTTAADSTGNNHPCELTSPGWVSPGILYGSAFSLDGTRSCQIAGTDALSTPDMTVAVWMKGSVLPGPGELGCLFTIGDTFELCVQPSGSMYFNVITDTYHAVTSPSNVQDGVARLITGVYGPSAGEGQRLYVNEAQVGFLAATGNLTYPYGTLSQVGRYFTSGPYAYKGVIQDVMVFNYALDQQAIANIYNNRVAAVNVFSPHMAWVSGTTSAVLAIDTAMSHRIEEPIAVRSTIANSGPEITEFFRLAVCNVTDCDADSDWLEVKPTVNALGVYLDADPSVGLTSNTLQNLNGDGFAYHVGRYVTHIPVVLEWDASTDPQVVGYKVHYGTAPGIYTQVSDVGASLTATITGLDLGLTYYFAATAYRADLIESDLSNEVSQSLRNVTTLATGVLTEWEYRRVRFTTPAQIGHQFKFRVLRESSLPLTAYNNTPILTLTGPPLDFVSGGGSFSGTSNR